MHRARYPELVKMWKDNLAPPPRHTHGEFTVHLVPATATATAAPALVRQLAGPQVVGPLTMAAGTTEPRVPDIQGGIDSVSLVLGHAPVAETPSPEEPGSMWDSWSSALSTLQSYVTRPAEAETPAEAEAEAEAETPAEAEAEAEAHTQVEAQCRICRGDISDDAMCSSYGVCEYIECTACEQWMHMHCAGLYPKVGTKRRRLHADNWTCIYCSL